jgi:predicted XRE-type DNA-binding protein
MDLAIAINDALAEQNLRQADIAKRIGATQPQVSALTNYKLSGFSIERLLGFLKALNRDVEIVCRSSGQAQGRVRVRQMA